jgi:hypothetical protein
VGLPDYGSLGASCQVEFELDSSLLQRDLDSFQRHVRDAYVACSQAVNDELARQRASGLENVQTPMKQSATPHADASSGNGNGNGNHNASQKQLDYVQQLARQIRGLGVRKLEELAHRMFNKPLAAASSLEASSLIDTLKAIKAGQLSLDDVLDGAAS